MTRDRHPAARALDGIALVAGMVGLGLVVRELGWSGIRRAVLGTGAWFAVVAAIDLCGALCDAIAVRSFIGGATRVSFRRVFAAQISGLAINRLTPGNSLGEPVKVTMLARAVPVDVAVSAVVKFNLATIYLGIAAIAAGVPLTALLLDLPAEIERVIWIGLAMLVAVAVVLAWLVHRGAIGTLIDALAGLGLIATERGTRWRARIGSIDARLRAVGDGGASELPRGLAGVFGSRCFNWAGTIVVLHAIDIPLTAPIVIASLTVGILVTWMSNIIPLGLGLADGTNYALYGVLGASPAAGLLFTMVNRLRTVVLALIGLAVMLVAGRAYGSRGATSESRVA